MDRVPDGDDLGGGDGGEFKQVLGIPAEVMVTVPTVALPLHDSVSLFSYVRDFETVLLEV